MTARGGGCGASSAPDAASTATSGAAAQLRELRYCYPPRRIPWYTIPYLQIMLLPAHTAVVATETGASRQDTAIRHALSAALVAPQADALLAVLGPHVVRYWYPVLPYWVAHSGFWVIIAMDMGRKCRARPTCRRSRSIIRQMHPATQNLPPELIIPGRIARRFSSHAVCTAFFRPPAPAYIGLDLFVLPNNRFVFCLYTSLRLISAYFFHHGERPARRRGAGDFEFASVHVQLVPGRLSQH